MTNFQDLVAKVKNLVALAPVLSTISRPGMSCMMGGSQVDDSFMQSLSYLGVVEAIPLVRSSLVSLSYEKELIVCFVKETNASEESALSFHLIKDLPTQMLLLR